MANHVSHAALPYPIKNARYTIQVPYLDADGDPTDPTTPDTERSIDGALFADCAEEVTTISGSNGTGYITLTGAETDASMLAVVAKVASGPKATIATLYPRVLAEVGTGTLSAGSAGGGTLGTLLPYDVTGCFLKTTGGTGGGGAGGAANQARKIVTYSTSTGAFTVAPNWETTPDNTTTYAVLLPEGVTLSMLRALFDSYGEPAQGVPPVSASVLTKIGWLFTAWRNKKTQTASEQKLFADDGATVIAKSPVSDDGTTLTAGEFISGP